MSVIVQESTGNFFRLYFLIFILSSKFFGNIVFVIFIIIFILIFI